LHLAGDRLATAVTLRVHGQ